MNIFFQISHENLIIESELLLFQLCHCRVPSKDWKPLEAGKNDVMVIDTEAKMVENHNEESRDFWQNTVPKLFEKKNKKKKEEL